jgi:phage terminase large subunit GpA-like protein
MQFLTWSQVKWPEGKHEEAYYECNKCKARWSESKRDAAVLKGEWRATATPKDKSHASFHLSSLYSLWTKFGKLAEKFLRTKALPNELQDFINSELGEPFIRDAQMIGDNAISKHVATYNRGQIPSEALGEVRNWKNEQKVVIMGVDVQKYQIYWIAREYIGDGDSGLVDWGMCTTFDEINNISLALKADYVGIDCGYRGQEVLQASLRLQFIPCRGVPRRMIELYKAEQKNAFEGTKGGNDPANNVWVIQHDSDQIKDMLFDRIVGGSDFLWYIPPQAGMDPVYLQHMTSEQCTNRWELKKPGLPNHWWDCEVITLLLATIKGFNKYIKEYNAQDADRTADK